MPLREYVCWDCGETREFNFPSTYPKEIPFGCIKCNKTIHYRIGKLGYRRDKTIHE